MGSENLVFPEAHLVAPLPPSLQASFLSRSGLTLAAQCVNRLRFAELLD